MYVPKKVIVAECVLGILLIAEQTGCYSGFRVLLAHVPIRRLQFTPNEYRRSRLLYRPFDEFDSQTARYSPCGEVGDSSRPCVENESGRQRRYNSIRL